MAELRTPQGHTLLLPDGPLTIGADSANDVPVAAHLGLAPLHFRLQPWEGGHFIEDAGSGLGTLVNGHAINWKPLAHGDLIVAGELEVIYSQSAAALEGGPGTVLPPPAPPAALIPALPAPSFSEITPPPLLSLEASGPHVLMSAPPLAAPPPSWLPEDLLPENQHKPAVAVEVPPGGSPLTPAAEVPLFSQGPSPGSTLTPPRRLGRLLPLAAVLALLSWAGHAAWQSGKLDGLFHSLQSAWGKTSGQPPRAAPERLPATEPAPPPPGNKVALPSPPLTP